MAKYKAVLFDLDGTLADTDLMIVETFLTMLNKYRPQIKPRLSEIVYFSGPPLNETMRRLFPEGDNAALVKEFQTLSTINYQKYVIGFPHIVEMISTLKAEGIKTGIITGKVYDKTLVTLELIGLDPQLFDVIICVDQIGQPKPDKEGMIKALTALDITAHDAIYIGDNNSDYYFARNAGTDVGLVTWGLRKYVPDLTPEYWIDDFRQWIKEISNE